MKCAHATEQQANAVHISSNDMRYASGSVDFTTFCCCCPVVVAIVQSHWTHQCRSSLCWNISHFRNVKAVIVVALVVGPLQYFWLMTLFAYHHTPCERRQQTGKCSFGIAIRNVRSLAAGPFFNWNSSNAMQMGSLKYSKPRFLL